MKISETQKDTLMNNSAQIYVFLYKRFSEENSGFEGLSKIFFEMKINPKFNHETISGQIDEVLQILMILPANSIKAYLETCISHLNPEEICTALDSIETSDIRPNYNPET
jgi:hypothetical protein